MINWLNKTHYSIPKLFITEITSTSSSCENMKNSPSGTSHLWHCHIVMSSWTQLCAISARHDNGKWVKFQLLDLTRTDGQTDRILKIWIGKIIIRIIIIRVKLIGLRIDCTISFSGNNQEKTAREQQKYRY